MFAMLASLVIVSASVAAIAVIVLTVQAQSAAIRHVIADSRAIARDREFLVHLISHEFGGANGDAAIALPFGASRLRPATQRAFSRRLDAPVLQTSFQTALQREVA